MKNKWARLYANKVTKDYPTEKILQILSSNRGIKHNQIDSFLNPPSPFDLFSKNVGIDENQLDKAVKIINQVGKKKKIIIYGDYDIDGLSATALLWESLWQSGYNVLPYVPDRKTGYGLKEKVISKLIKDHPDMELLITVDNGIVAYQAVEYARKQGLKVIITDHHLQGDRELSADALIHSTQIAGCGVAWFLAREFSLKSVDLVALGTIGDLLPLVGPNRSFVKFGLAELSDSKRPGIRALKKVSGLELNQKIVPWQVSFILSPRLNAAGRISDPMESLRLFCTRRKEKAFQLAANLDSLNNQRQEMMSFGIDLAKEIFTQKNNLILVSSPDFHPGIIGLIAGRLVEEFSRPAIAIHVGEEVSKGSARSVSGINIVDLIRQVDHQLINFGGHPMAAGFSFKSTKLDLVFSELQQAAADQINEKDLILKKDLDFEISFPLINHHFYQLINRFSPFGIGNPKPTFLINNLRVVDSRTVGANNQHLKMQLDDPQLPKSEKMTVGAIGFNFGKWGSKLLPGDLVNIVFNLDLNKWNGKETIQLRIKDLELC